VVQDFSGTSVSKLNEDFLAGQEHGELCGRFRAFQLDKPFGSWRDTIVAVYQKATLKSGGNSLLKPIILAWVMIMIVLTGCYRKTQGKLRYTASKKNDRIQTTTVSGKLPENRQ